MSQVPPPQPRPARTQLPIALVKWYDTARWRLERVDRFPKNPQFISDISDIFD